MPTFAFTARNRAGQTVRGRRTLGSEQALALDLAGEGLFLIRVRPARAATPREPRLNAKDLNVFLLHLAAYLEAGLSLLDALRDYRDLGRPALAAAFRDMSARLAGGDSLSAVMAAHPGLFKPVHVAMVKAGETMGRLDQALRAVIELVEWDQGFRAQVRQAASYPLLLIGLLTLLGIVITTRSLPPIMALLDGLQVPLPQVTRVFLAGGSFLVHHGARVVALAGGLGLGLNLALRHPGFRLRWDTALLGLPLVGPMVTRMALARFAHFLGQQYRAGIPLLQALDECEKVTGNLRMGLNVRRIREGVEQGERLAVMAERVGGFPPMVIRMLAIGEETGSLEETLARTARQFDAEGTAGVRLLFQALDPMLKVAMAGGLIFVACAVLLPIYTLIGAINE
jgi:type IV pilus assembly protein PilC